jgi:threonyl-tRNA synthetase
MLHVDSFSCGLTARGRSPVVEEPENPSISVAESLLLLTSVELEDEGKARGVILLASREIESLSAKIGIRQTVVHPFAHLFGEPACPHAALEILKGLEQALRSMNFEVLRTPFGWFHTMEIRAKGHPLSRVARLIRAA